MGTDGVLQPARAAASMTTATRRETIKIGGVQWTRLARDVPKPATSRASAVTIVGQAGPGAKLVGTRLAAYCEARRLNRLPVIQPSSASSMTTAC